MDPVDALNRVFANPESYEANKVEAYKYAQACAERFDLKLKHRPDIADMLSRAQDGPEDYAQLNEQAHKIQSSGKATLERVEDVTSRIRRLDTAKENLTSTIRMLRQLKILTKLYIQLDSLLKERRYEDMADSVKAASDLIDYFRPFRPLPQISQISQEIGQMESKIYDQVESDFRQALTSSASEGSATALKAACVVLDSIDSATGKFVARNRLLDFYVDHMLSEYSHIFNPQDEAGTLENVKRRFTYLKNKVLLVFLSVHHKYFPPSWNVRQTLVNEMCLRTGNDLVSQVHSLRSADNSQIQLLLSTLHESDDFEIFAKATGKITSRIIPFLSLWVDFQDRQLALRINSYAKMLLPPGEGDNVISSSKELVNFYRALLTQLSQLKHQRKTIEQMASVMADHLRQYATEVLMAYLPSSNIRSLEELRVLGIVNATSEYIINTTNQLERNVVTQVVNATDSNETPAKSVKESASADPVADPNGGSEEDEGDNTSNEIEALFERALSRYRHVEIRVEDLFVHYFQRSVEPLWIELAAKYTAVHRSGQSLDVSRVSPYTLTIVELINGLLTSIFEAAPQPPMISTVGYRASESVCTSFLTLVLARVPKPVGEFQAEQLLLDFGAVKSQTLQKVVDLAPKEIWEKRGASRLERLTPKIIETANHTEAVLKLLMTPSQPLDTFVMNYQLLVKDRSTLNFRKILEVKGIRFHNEAMSKFKFMASQESSLLAENPLLRSIPTVPPPTPSGFSAAFESSPSLNGSNGTSNGPGGAFNMNLKKLSGLLRRDN